MTELDRRLRSALRLYAWLVRLYPRDYRSTFGAQMLQTFKDQYRDILETEGTVKLGFWIETIVDETNNITKEHVVSLKLKPIALGYFSVGLCLGIGVVGLRLRLTPVFSVALMLSLVLSFVARSAMARPKRQGTD